MHYLFLFITSYLLMVITLGFTVYRYDLEPKSPPWQDIYIFVNINKVRIRSTAQLVISISWNIFQMGYLEKAKQNSHLRPGWPMWRGSGNRAAVKRKLSTFKELKSLNKNVHFRGPDLFVDHKLFPCWSENLETLSLFASYEVPLQQKLDVNIISFSLFLIGTFLTFLTVQL
jgi:hypothetical protein